MNYLTEPLTFTVPLLPQACYQAKRASYQSKNPEKAREIYLNRLAIHAVNFYLSQCLEIKTDWHQSESCDIIMQSLLDVADLKVIGLGKLECRPVLPGDKVCHVPAEVWSERIGYVIVQIDEAAKEATLLGFVKQVDTEELPISQLRSLEDLIESLEPLTERLSQTVIRLGQWLQDLFEPDWQPVELVLASAYRSNIRPKSSDSNSSEGSLSRAKVFDLGMQLADQAVALIVQLATRVDGLVDIRLRVLPVGTSLYLPQGLELTVLDNEATVAKTEARLADNWIQLELEEGWPGDEFSVKLTLGDFSITENFII